MAGLYGAEAVPVAPGSPLRLRRSLCGCLIAAVVLAGADDCAARGAARRTKRSGQGSGAAEVVADESVAEQVNDPSSFLREIRVDTTIGHGEGSQNTTVEWIPTLAMPLSQRTRFEAGIPILSNGPGDNDEFELGDVYLSAAYIFFQSAALNALADLRIDLPTGNDRAGAGMGVTQWHASLGTVVYTFLEEGFLIVPFLEYRRSIPGGSDSVRVSTLIGRVGIVYLLSESNYVRSDWTVNFNEPEGWGDSALLNVEVGRVFMDRYSVALGYEFDLWGDAFIRNAAIVSVGYLF